MNSYNSPKSIAMLIWPSLRSLAYLEALNKCKLFPNEVIIIQNSNFGKVNEELLSESKKYNYHTFFKISNNIDDFFEEKKDCKVININTNNINDPMVIQAVEKLKNVTLMVQ